MLPAAARRSRNLTGLSGNYQLSRRLCSHQIYIIIIREIILAQFRMYDVDENGMIDLNEMTKLVRSIFKVSNQSQVTLEKQKSR